MRKPKYLAFKFTILGHPWVVYYCTERYYKRKNGKDSVGITHLDSREIYVRAKHLSRETVVHELTHAYFAELCTHSADITSDALEEIFCDLMAKYGSRLLRQADKIMSTHKKLLGKVGEQAAESK